MLIVVLLAVSVTAGLCAWQVSARALRRWSGPSPGVVVAEEVREHSAMRRLVRSRLDAEQLTGLALTVALVTVAAAGVAVSLLALLVRRSEALADVDAGSARWAHHHSGDLVHRLLSDVSTLASTPGVVVIAVTVGIIEWVRLPSRWIPAFLLVVTVGDSLVTNTVKGVIDRARPTIDPAAAALGPSFPSGHSSTAAALFAALALLAGRARSPRARARLIGVAVGLAVAVACSRVLLDLHWVSDVIAGLALGWGWFAVCAIAFGGWLLRFGEPAERAVIETQPERDSVPS